MGIGSFGYGEALDIYDVEFGNYVTIALNVSEVNTAVSKIARMFSSVEFEANTEQAQKLIDKIYEPNPFQSKSELLHELMFYKLSAGFVNLLPYHESKGFETKINLSSWDKVQLFVIDNDGMKWDYRSNKYTGLFEFEQFGKKYKRHFDDVITFYDSKIHSECHYWGVSRLEALKQELYIIQLAKQGRVNKIELTGSIIVTPDEPKNQFDYQGLDQRIPGTGGEAGLSKTHREDIEDKLRSIGLANKKQIKVLSRQVKAINLAESIKDIDFSIDTKEATRAIYSKYSLGRELQNLDDNGGKYDNRDQALIEAFQEEIVPFTESFIMGLETSFGLNQGDISADYSKIPIYQKWQRFEKMQRQEDAIVMMEMFEKLNSGALTDTQFNDLNEIINE